MNIHFAACVFAAITLSACNSSTPADTSGNHTKTATDTTTTPAAHTGPATAVSGIVNGYLHLKNALTKDNGNDAAAAGTEIITAIAKTDTTAMTAEQRKAYAAVADDIKENAEHISRNSGKIDHQREHFEMLSEDIEDLVKAFGSDQTLYKDFCQMAFDGKGASWLSEFRDIKNPYFGDEMLKCGEIKAELK